MFYSIVHVLLFSGSYKQFGPSQRLLVFFRCMKSPLLSTSVHVMLSSNFSPSLSLRYESCNVPPPSAPMTPPCQKGDDHVEIMLNARRRRRRRRRQGGGSQRRLSGELFIVQVSAEVLHSAVRAQRRLLLSCFAAGGERISPNVLLLFLLPPLCLQLHLVVRTPSHASLYGKR